MSVWEAVATAAGGVIAALLGVWAKRRLTSGTVQTSDAQMLWKEAGVMRQGLTDQIVILKAENARLVADLEKCRGEHRASR